MSYIDKHLMAGEKIVFRTKLNWTEYLSGFGIILLGIIVIPFVNEILGGFIILIGLIVLGVSYLRVNSSEYAVTNKRVLIKVGIIKTESVETILNKIEGIYVEQGIMGKIFNSGTIRIKGTGGTNTPYKNIDKPFEFRNAVNEQISKI